MEFVGNRTDPDYSTHVFVRYNPLPMPAPPFRLHALPILAALLLAGTAVSVAQPAAPAGGAAAVARAGAADEPAPKDVLSDPEWLARAKSYTRGNYLLYLADTAWTVLVLAWLAFGGISSRVWGWMVGAVGRGARSSLLYIAALVVFMSLATLPLDYYDGFVREHAYGFSTQTTGGWLADRVRGLGVSVIVFSIFALPLYGAIRRFPRRWWMIGAALGCALATLLVVVTPVIVDPLFNDFTPLPDSPLKTRILDMARENGIHADDVYQMDASSRSVHDNAYVTGLLGTQRIVLYDTLLASYEPDEIAFIMGHEMGHYVLDHIWKGLALGWILIAFVFWVIFEAFNAGLARFARRTGFEDASELSTLPLMLLVVTLTLFVTLPLQSAFSRHIESQADEFALENTPDPGAGVRAFRKMAARNLSDPDPPALVEWFLYSHPAIGKRIERAEEHAKHEH